MADGRSSVGVAFNTDPLMNGSMAGVGFSAPRGLMEAFECGEEASSVTP